MSERLKHLLVRCLPRGWRRALRQWNSLRQVRAFTAERWPCAPVVRALVRPGDCVVDAGANMGYITALLAGWVGPTGRVHSIEPVPDTYDLLVRGVRALGLAQVRTHHCAVSAEAGEGTMAIPSYAEGGENFYESHLVAGGRPAGEGLTVRVPLRRLDDIVGDDVARIRFLKIDVEGHEGPALQGAEEILRQARPALLVEVAGDPDDAGSAAAGLFRALAARGYAAYCGETSLRPRRPGDRAVDYYFLLEPHLDSVRPFVVSQEQP